MPAPHQAARRRRSRVAVALLVLAFPGATLVLAQTASQITPPTFRPPPPSLGGAVVFSGQPGLEAPPGAERLSITISGVSVEGALPDMGAASAALEGRLVGKPVPVSEIFAAAQALEEAYARAGYVLARVVIPEQSLANGERLRLVVVNGFIERLDTAAVPEPVRGRIERVVEPLVGQRNLKLGEIERRLLIAGDTYGVALRSALSPGDEAGGAVLVVEADYHKVTGSVGHRQHARRRPRHLDAGDGRRGQQRLQARRDDLLPRLRLSGRRRRGRPRRPLHRLPAHPHPGGGRGLPDRQQRAHLQRRGHRQQDDARNRPTASRPGPSSSASPSAPSTRSSARDR